MTAIGDHELEAELGRGGMGVVHRARHVPTGAARAVKVLAGPTDPELVERFRREASSLARVAGDAVVPVHTVLVERGRLALVMGLMSGGSLRDRLRREGRLATRDAVTLVAGLARGLARCHEAGIVHRDLKPENVLFDDDGRPRLADFGCARDLDAATLTETGTILGTPAYMAPEQLDGKRVDARADVYALGLLLHEVVAGELPFARSGSIIELLDERHRGRRAPLVPAALDRVVARALAPDPAARTPSARALASELDEVLAGEGGPSRAPLVLVAGAVVGAAVLALALRERPHVAVPPPAAPAAAPPIPPSAPPPRAPTVDPAAELDVARRMLERRGDLAVVEKAVARALAAGPSPPERVEAVVALLRRRAEGACASPYERREDELRGLVEEVVRSVALGRSLDPRFAVDPGFPRLLRLVRVRWDGAARKPVDALMLDALVLACEVDPDLTKALRFDAEATAPEGKPGPLFDKALTTLDAACERWPDDAQLRYARGFLNVVREHKLRLTARGSPEWRATSARAIADLEAVVRHEPRTSPMRAWATYFVALLEEQLGRVAEAAALLDELESPADPKLAEFEFQRNRARILLEAGRNRDAARVLRTVLERTSGRAEYDALPEALERADSEAARREILGRGVLD